MISTVVKRKGVKMKMALVPIEHYRRICIPALFFYYYSIEFLAICDQRPKFNTEEGGGQ